jgi:hypothetical protein
MVHDGLDPSSIGQDDPAQASGAAPVAVAADRSDGPDGPDRADQVHEPPVLATAGPVVAKVPPRADGGRSPALPGEALFPGEALRQAIDEWILPLGAIGASDLDSALGERLQRLGPLQQCLCVLADYGCAGLDCLAPRLHGTMHADQRHLYARLIVERDPLLTRATQEWTTVQGTIEEHCAWIESTTRNAEVIRAWLTHLAKEGAGYLAVVPARGALSRGALFAFYRQRPQDGVIFALFYAAQRLAETLEMRYRPYLADLLAMRFQPREMEVLRAGLRGAADGQIAARLGLSVDAIRYYFKKLKHRVPPVLGHLKPRELARILHQLGKL